jgi:hypothetical protein
MQETRRATIYLDAAVHHALRVKAANLHCSISEIVNQAMLRALREDADDLAAFEERVAEPEVSYEALLKDLRKHGKL